MIYVIENKIAFNPEDNTLFLQDDADCQVTISNPARRILLLLIEHHGSVVQRETLFEKVWDDFGLVSSNNNLNHCISKLRKVINTLGHNDEVIITVPKVGFLLKKEIIISKLEMPISSNIATHQVIDEPLNAMMTTLPLKMPVTLPTHQENEEKTQKIAPETSRRKQTRKYHNMLIISISFIILLTELTTIVREYFHDSKDRLQITTLGNCVLYSTSIIPLSQKPIFIRLARQFIDKRQIACTPGDILIFQSEAIISLTKTGASRDFLSQCRVNSDNDTEACLSIYVNNRKNNDNR